MDEIGVSFSEGDGIATVSVSGVVRVIGNLVSIILGEGWVFQKGF